MLQLKDAYYHERSRTGCVKDRGLSAYDDSVNRYGLPFTYESEVGKLAGLPRPI